MSSVSFYFFPPCCATLWDSKTSHRPAGERVSWCLETSLPSRLPPLDKSLYLTLLSLFLSFIFCPTSIHRQWAAFWVPGVLPQHSEVVLWNLLSGQMIFQWICGGGSGLPILFLHHLRTAPNDFFWLSYFHNYLLESNSGFNLHSLFTNGIKNLFMCLFGTCKSFLVEYVFMPSANFLISSFAYCLCRSLYILIISPFLDNWFANIFFCSESLLFYFVDNIL